MLSVYPSDRATAALVLAHGAGGGQKSRFMVEAANAFAARGIAVATFDFPYMAQGRSAPDKPAVLESRWREVIEEARQGFGGQAGLPLFIGGKSMGGRIASQVAAQQVAGISGLVYLGYPLHPPGRPEQRRDRHLPDIKEPMLFVGDARSVRHGRRDPRVAAGPESTRNPVRGRGRRPLVQGPREGDRQKRGGGALTEIFDTVTGFIQTCAKSTSR